MNTDLCTAVSRESVVPEALVGTGQRLLVVVVFAMRGYSSCKGQKRR